jgi:hypothetical protein
MDSHNSKNHHGEGLTLLYVLGIIFIVLLLVNSWQIYYLQSKFGEKSMTTEVPKVELAIITANSCEKCFDITTISSKLSSLGVEIKEQVTLDYESASAKALISKYKVSHVPALIIKGDVEKAEKLKTLLTELAVEQEGNYILPSPMPPYIDADTGKMRGEVGVVLLEKENCDKCADLTMLVELLKQQVAIKDVKKVGVASTDGKALVKKYNISVVPTLIFDSEAALYPTISGVWKKVGSVEKDGSLVMRMVNPPFYSIPEGKVKGLVTLTTIEDKSCKECYNASINKLILQQMGVQLEKEKTLDVLMPEAQGLISKYKITKVPTVVIKGDVSSYTSLVKAWNDVGSVETDGAYVLRKVELFQQPYKDLEQNKVVTPVVASVDSAVGTEQVSTPVATN